MLWIAAVPLVFAAAFLAATLAPTPLINLVDDPNRTLWGSGTVAALFAWLLLRRLVHQQRAGFLGALLVQFYFLMLALGLVSLSALRILGAEGVPIAATQVLPDDDLVLRALLYGVAGGALLGVGVLVASLWRTGRAEAVPDEDAEGINTLRMLVPLTFGAGCLGLAIVTMQTGQIALFSSNIDVTRYSQGSGVGYASLLQYELLSCACISLYLAVILRRATPLIWAAIPASLVLLLIFRVERTPVVLIGAFAAIAFMRDGRTLKWRTVLVTVIVLVVAVGGLGVLRLGSATQYQDNRATLVRPLYDLAPEFREQAFAYDIYPDQQPYLGIRGVAAVGSSIVPSGLLSLAGIDKSKVYSDISRDYSSAMRELGYYTIDKPLRVGIGGEFWGDFGPGGLIVGFLGLGYVFGRVARAGPQRHLGRCAFSMAGAISCFAMITPLASLVPVGLMILLPVGVASVLVRRRALR